MVSLEERLEELGIGKKENSYNDIKRIIAQAIHQILNETPIVKSLQIFKALRELNKKGIIRDSISDRPEDFISTAKNPLMLSKGIYSIQLRDAIMKFLGGEIPGFEIKIHYHTSAGGGGTVYYKDEQKLEEYIRNNLSCRPRGTIHYDFRLD